MGSPNRRVQTIDELKMSEQTPIDPSNPAGPKPTGEGKPLVRAGLRWLFLGILLAVSGLGGIGFQLLRFLNLRNDLRFFPSLHHKASWLAFSNQTGVSFGSFKDGVFIYGGRQKFLDDPKAFVPGSIDGIATYVHVNPQTIATIVSRVDATLASFPVFTLASGPIGWEKGENIAGSFEGEGGLWCLLAASRIGKDPPLTIAKILIGAELIGVHACAVSAPLPMNVIRFAASKCEKLAASVMIRCAPTITLSRPETILIVDILDSIETRRTSFAAHLRYRREFFRTIGDHYRTRPFLGRKVGWYLWPDEVLREMLADPEVVEFFGKKSLEPLIDAEAGPWIASNPLLAPLKERFDHSFRMVREEGFQLWLNYGLFPREYLKSWFTIDEWNFLRSLYQLDVECRQLSRMARWAFAVFGFRRETGKWPRTPGELEKWLGKPLPGDLFSYGPVLFCPGNPPDVRSIGPDQTPFTKDDMGAVAIGSASATAFLKSRIALPSAAR